MSVQLIMEDVVLLVLIHLGHSIANATVDTNWTPTIRPVQVRLSLHIYRDFAKLIIFQLVEDLKFSYTAHIHQKNLECSFIVLFRHQ